MEELTGTQHISFRAVRIYHLTMKAGRWPKRHIKNTKICEELTGDHAFFLLDSPEIPVKQFLVSIEESHPLGRLFNLDVCGLDGVSVKRQDLHTSFPWKRGTDSKR